MLGEADQSSEQLGIGVEEGGELSRIIGESSSRRRTDDVEDGKRRAG